MPTWIGSSDGLWTSATNWAGGVPNGVGAVATFVLTSNSSDLVVSLPNATNVTLGVLDITATGNGGLLFAGTGSAGTERFIFNNGANNAQVNVTGPNEVVFVNTLGLQVELASNTIFNIAEEALKLELAAPVFGTGTLIKTGAGRVFLNNSHSFSGGIILQEGLIDYQSDASLGSGAITISNNAQFIARSTTAVDNLIETLSSASGSAGSATIGVFDGATLTFSGTLAHLSSGTISFGRTGNFGTVVASFALILENATDSAFAVHSGTLRMGNAFNAANLFSRPGPGVTAINAAGALDTAGFATIISNLDMNGGTILSSTGALNVTVNDIVGGLSQAGSITGTAGADSLTINTSGNFSISALFFNSWTNGTDTITLNGSAGSNTLNGNAFNNVINGFDGDDVLPGFGGVDIISGGDGNDLIILNGANGGSSVSGGTGNDELRIAASVSLGSVSGFETLDLLSGATVTMSGTQFTNGFGLFSTLSGTGSIVVNVASGGTTINARGMTVEAGSTISFAANGSTGVDVIKGVLGASNNLQGNAGTDQLVGGSLADIINGGDGTDKIRGDAGGDILTGGSGPDVFKYRSVNDSTVASPDIITDFVSGIDRLNFSRIDTNPGLAGDQAFIFMNTAAFAGGGVASIRWVDLASDLRVEADVNGDGVADMHVLLQGAGAQVLTAGEFVL